MVVFVVVVVLVLVVVAVDVAVVVDVFQDASSKAATIKKLKLNQITLCFNFHSPFLLVTLLVTKT